MAPEKRRVSLVSDEVKRKLIEDNAIRVANMDKTMVFNKPSSSSSRKSPASKRAKVDDLPTVDKELKETKEGNRKKSQPAKNTRKVRREDGKTNKTVGFKRPSSSSSGKALDSKRRIKPDHLSTVVNKLKETNEKNSKKSQPAANSLKVHREVGKTVEKKASTTDKQKRKLMDEAASRAKINKKEGFKRPSSSSKSVSKRVKVEDLPCAVNKLKHTNEESSKKSRPATKAFKGRREVETTVDRKALTSVEKMQKREIKLQREVRKNMNNSLENEQADRNAQSDGIFTASPVAVSSPQPAESSDPFAEMLLNWSNHANSAASRAED